MTSILITMITIILTMVFRNRAGEEDHNNHLQNITTLNTINTIMNKTMVIRNRAGEEEVKKENGSRSRARQSYDLNQVKMIMTMLKI